MSNRVAAYMSGQNDQDLMRRVLADDTLAFAELYDRYSPMALSLARMICGSTERAQEAVQDGFLNAWRDRARYDQARGTPKTWLLALIRYRSIDNYRRNRDSDRLRTSEDYLQMVPGSHDVEDDAVRHDEGNRLRVSLQQLPARQREVIVLAYFGGLTHTEIGKQLAVPLGTVKGRMRLGLSKLVAELKLPSPERRDLSGAAQ